VEVEVEEVEVEEEVEEEEDVYEIQINGKTYYVMNETDSIIYEADENGEITIEAGVYKNGKPTF
jgi:YHS domain-containing protein